MLDTFLNYTLYFFFYSNAGWLIESIYCSYAAKKWINRGFLTGPICPIYGAGALVMAIFLERFADRWYLVFILGVILCDIVEFVTSVILEKLFHARWWDYSNKFMNIQGRICLLHSTYWGVMSLVFVYLVHPFFRRGFELIPDIVRNVILAVILVIFTYDFAKTVIATADIRKLNTKLADMKNSLLTQGKKIGIKTAEINRQFDELQLQFAEIRKSEGTKRSKTARMYRASTSLAIFPKDAIKAIADVLSEVKDRINDEYDEML